MYPEDRTSGLECRQAARQRAMTYSYFQGADKHESVPRHDKYSRIVVSTYGGLMLCPQHNCLFLQLRPEVKVVRLTFDRPRNKIPTLMSMGKRQ